jgi:hypothetical protein
MKTNLSHSFVQTVTLTGSDTNMLHQIKNRIILGNTAPEKFFINFWNFRIMKKDINFSWHSYGLWAMG